MKKALVISVVGSGGKTTFIQQAAQKAAKEKKQAAVVTTTHMWIPKQHCILGASWENAVKMMEEEGIVYFGKAAEAEGKMVFPGKEGYQALCARADVVFVEADGAKEKPMKFPDWNREPVIPENTDRIVVIFGLSALGKPLKDVCHRWELGEKWIKKISESQADFQEINQAESRKNHQKIKQAESQADFQEINQAESQKNHQKIKHTESGEGRNEYAADREVALLFLRIGYLDKLAERFPKIPLTVFLNQADDQERREAGNWMKKKLEEEGVSCEVVQMKEKKTISIAVIYMASGFGKRFGRNKLLEMVDEKPLYLHGLEKWIKWQKDNSQKENLERKVIVVSQYDEILEYASRQNLICVKNLQAAEGITASIHLGIAAAKEADYYLFSVADQPWLKQSTIQTFLQKFLALKEDCSIGCLCAKEGSGGNPVIFHRRYQEELFALCGDKGGSQVMKRYPNEVFRFFAEEEELRDIDRIRDI